MLGPVLTAIFCVGVCGLGNLVFGRLLNAYNSALQIGVSGIFGLGVGGSVSLPILLLPGGARWGIYLMAMLSLVGGVLGGAKFLKSFRKPVKPQGLEVLFVVAAIFVAAVSLVAVIAPSDSFDWDTLAYHLAVPKLWLLAGRMEYVTFIHHSNFPGGVDDLYVWGLAWGGEAGAKMFSWMFGLMGSFLIYGFAHHRYGGRAGWWGLLAYVGIPLVCWEAGTAYIDLSNGLFVAVGIMFALDYLQSYDDKNALWLSAIGLGFAVASKYTGLQTVFAVGLVEVAFAVCRRKSEYSQSSGALIKSAILAGLTAIAIGSPWYLKNLVNTGNPVYPFFYSVFKGKNWDTFSDKIYRHQQQTFGTGRSEASPNEDYVLGSLQLSRIPSAVLGLAYEPGRYTDPEPTQGSGFPFQSLGAIPLITILVWALSGRSRRYELAYFVIVLVSFSMWFFLSEQSRYIMGLLIPGCVLAGGAIVNLKRGKVLAAAIVVQVLASLYVCTRYPDENSRFAEKLKVVTGGQTDDEYRHRFISFFDAATELNKAGNESKSRVALYDEVFGFLLDVPYYWANPGHSTEMGYEQIQSAEDLYHSYQRLNIGRVYINLSETFGGNKILIQRWLQVAGLNGPKIPYPDRANQMKDPQTEYKVLLAEMVEQGLLVNPHQVRSGVIFDVVSPSH